MVFVIILVRTVSFKPCALCAAGVTCLFVHYLQVLKEMFSIIRCLIFMDVLRLE